MAKILRYLLSSEEKEKTTLFYLERVLEILEEGLVALAKNIFLKHQEEFSLVLSPEIYQHLQGKVDVVDDWSVEKEKRLWARLLNANAFGEHKIVHDLCHEILLHHHHLAETCSTHHLVDHVNQILASNNMHYLEPDDISINTILNSKITFIVEDRKSKNGNLSLRGNPGFYLYDALGRRYRCFVKQFADANVGDVLSLKVTNIPGLALASENSSEPVIYLEPRVTPGEIIEIELSNLSHTGNSFTFRYHSYDGFLWFKRRGVNKSIFNEQALHKGDRIVAKVLYISEEEKRMGDDRVSRLGVLKAIPLKLAAQEHSRGANQGNGVAKALN